jgi:hypothetical protein
VEWWQTLLVALATTVVGAVVSLVSAWLQHRRDARTQQAREGAESERLRLQLADAREQRQQDRAHADTMEWRERRLTTYEAASTVVHRFLRLADDVARDPAFFYPGDLPVDDAYEYLFDLERALSRCEVVGTEPTRTASLHLARAVGDLADVISNYYRMLDAATGPAAERDLSAAGQRFRAASETWHAAVRAELGVPDAIQSPTTTSSGPPSAADIDTGPGGLSS